MMDADEIAEAYAEQAGFNKGKADTRSGLLLAIKLLEAQADKEEVSETEADGLDMPESSAYHQYRGLALRKAVRTLKAEIEEGKK